MNITGQIMYTLDPHNLWIENVIFDGYRIINAFDMPVMCNYPDAYQSASTYVKNFTGMMSFDRTSALSTNAFFSLNPGDFWMEDVTFEEYYMLITNIKAGIAVAATTG